MKAHKLAHLTATTDEAAMTAHRGSTARIRATLAALAAASVGFGCAATHASADGGGPSVTTRSPSVVRGDYAYVELSGLSAGASYSLTTSGGEFSASGTSSVDVLGDSTGKAQLVLDRTDTVPATTASLQLSLSSGGSVLSTDSVPFAAPTTSVINLCPVASAGLTGEGFADGDYHLSGAGLTFSPTVAHASGGRLSGVTVTADGSLPGSYTVSASIEGTSTVVATSSQQRRQAVLVEDVSGSTPWSVRYGAGCFAPGEKVRITSRDTSATDTAVTADSHGRIAAVVALHPSAAAHPFAGVDAHGLSSGQTGFGDLNGPLFGTTLLAGQKLNGDLVSAAPGFRFVGGCDPRTDRVRSDGSASRTWHALPRGTRARGCTVALRTNGDVVDLTSAGTALWHTGTAGTGSHNKLTMLSNGNLVLRNAYGTELWSSASGRAH